MRGHPEVSRRSSSPPRLVRGRPPCRDCLSGPPPLVVSANGPGSRSAARSGATKRLRGPTWVAGGREGRPGWCEGRRSGRTQAPAVRPGMRIRGPQGFSVRVLWQVRRSSTGEGRRATTQEFPGWAFESHSIRPATSPAGVKTQGAKRKEGPGESRASGSRDERTSREH